MSDERAETVRQALFDRHVCDGPTLSPCPCERDGAYEALESLEKENERLKSDHACCWHGWDNSAVRSLHDPEGACNPARQTLEHEGGKQRPNRGRWIEETDGITTVAAWVSDDE